ncbi:MAG: bifunctional precorrin-2 dehydrogenase/sirohydrochlorin ferrochelatase, partial [Armatimonadota bacterium]|nr:bifunctional precorrin-2 dehydrogenase/sirohydrochlorin ferrochelatase [Armatimonadota bacterium]
MAQFYPVALRLEGRRVLVVGAGAVARRKVKTLLACGARVRVVAPEADPELARLAAEGEIELVLRPYRAEDLDGAFLALAAANASRVNAQVAEDARRRGVLVNCADAPDASDFLVAAAVPRGDLLIGIFTGGNSPALARRLREEIEA